MLRVRYGGVVTVDEYSGKRIVFCKEDRGPKDAIVMSPCLVWMLIATEGIQSVDKDNTAQS